MAINVGKYKRPGIFIEEINQSIISPVVTEGIINLIPGFSKKGQPNSPIYLESSADANAIIGSIDRNLEKKGSYLHRTVYKMLESGPVWALNLLLTDDNLDTLEYQTISTASGYPNSATQTESYRRFFNTSGFWRRDTESFLNFASDGNVINFTSFRDRPITVFAIKSSLPGFNVTVQNWYEGVPNDQIPSFLRPTDLISDYNVRVVVVSGNWTDYSTLAVDQRYSLYFNTEGVRKSEFDNFLNDNTVTVLGDYEASLIPYFVDANGRDMFIENLINLETDRTGLFCAYDFDLAETDFPNRYLDLIGNTVVGEDIDQIDFLSYKEVITESLDYDNKELDSLQNTLGNTGAIGTRTIDYTDEYINDVTVDSTAVFDAQAVANPVFNITVGANGYYNFGGARYTLAAGATAINLPTVTTPSLGLVAERYDAIILNDSGFSFVSGVESIAAIPAPVKPTVAANAIVIAYALTSVDDAGVATNTLTHVTLSDSGYEWLDATDLSAPTLVGINELELIFAGTAGNIGTNQYEEYRRVKMYNNLNALLTGPNSDRAVIIDNSGNKHSIADAAVTVDESSDKTIRVIMNDAAVDISTQYATRTYVMYAVDNEFVIGSGAGTSSGMVTKNTPATTAEGVIAKYSDMYIDYQNGIINTGDYFWEKLVKTSDPVNFTDVGGVDYMILTVADNAVFAGLPHNYGNAGDKIWIEDTANNNGLKTIADTAVDPSTIVGLVDPATTLAYGAGTHVAYELVENTTSEYITAASNVNIHKGDQKVYMQFYTINDVLYVNYTNEDYTAEIEVSNIATINNTFKVYSNRNNFEQTLEVEFPSGYVQTPNKVLVDGTRYSEVKIGDFLKAYVDTGALNPGEEPKRITRIIDKRVWSGDPSLVEITCDSRIELIELGSGDFQTTRYTEIEEYVNTYKGLPFTGFRIRPESMPDGTEERQSQILDLMDSDTNLGKALIDRNSSSWRYLVDGFGLGLTERSKQQYVNVCGARLNVLGFINMPSMKKFKDSTSPSFVDDEGNLVTEFIKLGADPESNPAFRYTFGQGDGQTTVGYFCPYVNISDNNRPIDVPPAMYVATTYMRKHISRVSGLRPWTIAAGVNDGRIEAINRVEYDFLPEDIEQLNEMGANPIIYNTARNVHYIETENTAQQQPLSSLSFLHSREVLIELENALYNMLLDFQWKFNTAETRADIKFRADAICQRFVDQEGLFNYVNVVDETNNTNDIIDRQIGVIDTFVEISKGMGIIVNNITVLRTGAIESGGFNVA
jgi:hypothetical protein